MTFLKEHFFSEFIPISLTFLDSEWRIWTFLDSERKICSLLEKFRLQVCRDCVLCLRTNTFRKTCSKKYFFQKFRNSRELFFLFGRKSPIRLDNFAFYVSGELFGRRISFCENNNLFYSFWSLTDDFAAFCLSFSDGIIKAAFYASRGAFKKMYNKKILILTLQTLSETFYQFGWRKRANLSKLESACPEKHFQKNVFLKEKLERSNIAGLRAYLIFTMTRNFHQR